MEKKAEGSISHAPVWVRTAEAIRNDILSGVLVAGSRLTERDLTQRLSVSRNTVREALRQLETEGFLQFRPNRGAIVATMTESAVRDLFEVREALECMAVSRCTSRASDAELDDLFESFEVFAEAVRRGDTSAIVYAKDAFYDHLYAGAGNAELHAHARTMYARLAGLRLQSLSSPGRPAASLIEIRQVMQTMRRRDAERASELWAEHIHLAAAAALRVLPSA